MDGGRARLDTMCFSLLTMPSGGDNKATLPIKIVIFDKMTGI